MIPVPPETDIRQAGHHWLAEYDMDGHFQGFRVLQWQPGAKKWCHSGAVASGRDVLVDEHWRYCQPCPMPELKLPPFK